MSWHCKSSERICFQKEEFLIPGTHWKWQLWVYLVNMYEIGRRRRGISGISVVQYLSIYTYVQGDELS